MTHHNLQAMRQLLTFSPRPTLESMASDTDIVTKMMSYSKEMECKQRLQWTLNPTNNFLQQVSPSLEKYVFSKQMVAAFTLFTLANMVVGRVAPSWVFHVFVLSMVWPLFIPWFVAALMSVNKEMIPRIVTMVDTWIKIVTIAAAMGFSATYNLLTSESPTPLLIAFYVTSAINLCMAVTVVSSADGIYRLGRKSRVFLIGMMAAFSLFWCIVYRYFREDHLLQVAFLGNFTIHLRERVATAYEVNFIFLMKQALLSLFTEDRCTAVMYRPYIEWRLSSKAQWKQKYVANTNDLSLQHQVASYTSNDSP